jgi:hypothetical protein
MELLVISFANEHNRNYHNYRNSLKKFGYKFKILGKNQKWNGFNTKISSYYKYLTKLYKKHKDLLIAITDCYDVLACNKPQKLISKYLSLYNDKILFGCESNCLERNCMYISNLWKKKSDDKSLPPNKYLNSGFILGKISLVLELLKFTVNQYTDNGLDDDQLAMCYYAQKNPDKIILDTTSSIIATIHYDLFDYDVNEKRIKNIKTGKMASFIHTPGINSDMSYRLDSIGRVVLGTKYIEESKLKRIKNFATSIKNNKVHKLYAIIIMLILLILFYFIPILIVVFAVILIIVILKL